MVKSVDMKITVIEEHSLMPLDKAIKSKRISDKYVELSVLDFNGCTDSIVISDSELDEAVVQISRSKKTSPTRIISYKELREHQINMWGRSNCWRFKSLTPNKTVTISRGFVVYLLQDILGCQINRSQGFAHESISHFLGLGSQDSYGDRQIRRYRKKAEEYLVSNYNHVLEQGTEKSARELISNFILLQLFQAFNHIEEKINSIKSYILPTPLKMIQRAVMKKSVISLKATVNKIFGHIFDKTCPLATSH